MLDEVSEVIEIVGRGVAKAAGFRRHEKPATFEAGQSVVAVVIVLAITAAGLALLVGWFFAR